MGFFSPHKRHANEFNYFPRYYDPAKEAREQRRAELRGDRLDDDGEYTPGKYIRAKREARELRQAKEKQQNRVEKRIKMFITGVVLILLATFVYVLVPRFGEFFEMATSQTTSDKQVERQLQEYEDFNPYAPIVIVPNDYQEGDELEIKDLELE